ncbi:MAG: hypothetical protein ACRC8A_19440 [Microcoleaceae cyanobacterium]
MFNAILTQHRQVIRTFSSREAAGQSLDHLVFSGFPIAQVFLLGHGLTETQQQSLPLLPSTYGTITGTATGLKKGIVLGNLVGGTTGLLLGAGLMALPGLGQLMLSSAIAFTLLSGGVCTAAGGLMGGLIGLGLTSEQAKAYSQQISRGSVLLIVEGTEGDIARAEYILKSLPL